MYEFALNRENLARRPTCALIARAACGYLWSNQPDVHACPHTSTSALAIRTTSALIARAALVITTISALTARAALRISVISVSLPRSSKSLKKEHNLSVTFI